MGTSIFNRPNETEQSSNGRRRADAFLNINLEVGDRTPKIGAIPLYADRVVDRQIIEALKDDPEKAQGLVQRLVLRFNMADGSSSEPLDLSFLDEGEEGSDESAAA